MSKRKKTRTQLTSEQIMEASQAALEAEQRSRPTRRRRALQFVVLLFVAMLVLILLAPTIVSLPSVRDYVIAKVWPSEAGVLTIRSMKVGWFRPLTVQGVKVLDQQGMPLLDVEKVEGNRSIFELAKDYTDFGRLVITNPTVSLQLRPDGSNLEDTIAALVPAETESKEMPNEPSKPFAFAAQLKVLNARIAATETHTQEKWELQKFNLDAAVPKSVNENWTVQAEGALNNAPFAIELITPLAQATPAWPLGPQGNASVNATALPLQPLRYAALRAGQPLEELAGKLSLDTKADWQPFENSGLPKLTANAIVNASDFGFRAESILGKDHLRLRDVKLLMNVEVAGDHVSMKQCDFSSDFGSASLATTVNLLDYKDPAKWFKAIRRQQLKTAGRIDMAALAKTLPHTLKMREDVQVGSGVAGWNILSQVVVNEPTKWHGTLQTADVQLIRDGQPLDWQFPFEVRFSAVDGDELELENFSAQSESLFSFTGKGKLREGSLQGQADLEKMVYQLGQVIELQGLYVAGGLQTSINWNEQQTNQRTLDEAVQSSDGRTQLTLDGQTRLTQFVMAQNGKLLCGEEQLTLGTKATGTLDGQTLASLDSARLDIVSAGDFFVAQLQQQVDQPSAESSWPVACRLKGELATWLARLKPFGVGLDWQVAGQIDAQTQITANMAGAAIHSMVADVRNLSAATEGISVNEPVVQLKTAGTVDFNTFASSFPSTSLASKSVSVAAQNVEVAMDPHFVMAGDMAYRADIARVMAYMPSESTQTISGAAVGQLKLQSQQDTTNFQLTGSIDDLRVEDSGLREDGSLPAPLWEEPELTMQATGHYDALQDMLQLALVDVGGKVLNLSAQGAAANLSTQANVDLSGQFGYDLDGLMAIFGEMLGKDIRFTGQQTQQFAVKGPLFPTVPNSKALVDKQLLAKIGVGWNDANVYSMPLGSGQIDARLADGLLKMNPLQLMIGGGRAQLEPSVDVNSELFNMTLPAGTVLDKVSITPEMTSSWMKYIAPLLADATNAEGTFSVALAHCQVPLLDPTQGNVEGDFTIHGGALGPGPLATQFLDLASKIKSLVGKGESRITDPTKTWVQLQPQAIRFQLADERVYHEGFQMEIDGVKIQTRGSVGIVKDDINVVADIPILDEWVGSSALVGLKGKVVSIPITGTSSQPRLDFSALQQLSGQLVQEAAKGYLQNELSGKLQEKLGGKLQERLGGGLQDVLGGQKDPQELISDKLQKEIGRGLNKLFK